jgi:hypothetical protein
MFGITRTVRGWDELLGENKIYSVDFLSQWFNLNGCGEGFAKAGDIIPIRSELFVVDGPYN